MLVAATTPVAEEAVVAVPFAGCFREDVDCLVGLGGVWAVGLPPSLSQ